MSRIVRGKPPIFDYSDSRTKELSCFPYQSTPIVAKALLSMTYKTSWREGEHEAGRDMIVRCIVSIFEGCTNETANAVDRLYRLLDHTISGRVYTVDATVPNDSVGYIIPAIPAVPADFDGGYAESLVARFKSLEAVVRNASDGTAYGNYPQDIGQRQLLKDILLAIQNQQQGQGLDDEMLAELIRIAGLLV